MQLLPTRISYFGARDDNTFIQSWQRKFFEQIFFPTLDAYGIKTVLHGGDYFDRRKYTNNQTIRFVEETYRQPLRDRGIVEHAIVGNHDCFLRESTDISAVGELYRHDTSLRVYTQPTEIDVEGCGILMLPWICESTRAATEQAIRTSSASVVLGHLELAGFSMYRGMPNHEGMDPSVFDRFSLVMSGHYHHPSARMPIRYLGAPYPMVWSDYHDARGFHLFDTETHELTPILNPYTMFMRTVYDDAGQPAQYIEQLVASVMADPSPYRNAYVKIVVKSKTQPYWFELLLDALGKVQAQDVLVVDDIVVPTEGADESSVTTDIDTLSLIREYVDQLSVTCDKAELQQYLQTVYHDALGVSASGRVQ